MGSEFAPRYAEVRPISRHEDRRVSEATDRLTERSVLLKTDDLPSAARELRVLLALPRGVGPQVLDAVWSPPGALVLVLEWLSGKTLKESIKELPPERLPKLVHSISQRLVHLHRTGFVHTDLKPENLLVLEEGGEYEIRLLDFGFALSRSVDPRKDEVRGGTPQYLAPEVRRGWIVDGRADLFSLGQILNEQSQTLRDDSRWAPILERLCQEIPARRYPHALALRDELADRFGLPPSPDATPDFGAGPLRGRAQQLDQLRDRVGQHRGVGVLVQARPGVGLTRFLLEAVLAAAAGEMPPLRVLDIGSLGKDVDGEQVASFIEERLQAGDSVLCGVPDPSPGLHWIRDPHAKWLRRVTAAASWERLVLPPLEAESFVEVVADSLGSGGAAVAELANSIHELSDGDLASSSRAFLSCIRKCAGEEGLCWTLDPETMRSSLLEWEPEPSHPTLDDIPASLVSTLKTFARVGPSFTEEIASGLLAHLHSAEGLQSLLDHGYLEPGDPGRLQFVTNHLWREALAAESTQYAQIDIWLNDNLVPDPLFVDEVIRSCLRARRLKDRKKEAVHLVQALERAHSERRWKDLLRLTAYPEERPPILDVQTALHQVGVLKALLGRSWSEERILLLMAESIYGTNRALGMELLNRVANGRDPHAAGDALVLLLNGVADQPGNPDYETYSGALVRLEAKGSGAPPGVLDFYNARRALAEGKPSEAESLARKAAADLRGTGLLQESVNLQLLAALEFPHTPREAIHTLNSALSVVRDPGLLAQIRYNLTLMYGHVGDLENAAQCADEGTLSLRGRVPSSRLMGLRIQGAWTWAELDYIERAQSQAQELLNLVEVRQNRQQFMTVKALMGHCYLHRFSSSNAIRETAGAWEQSATGCTNALRLEFLRSLLDVFLDLEAWEAVREHGAEFQLDFPADDPDAVTTLRRVAALVAQVKGETQEAIAILEKDRDVAEKLSSRIAAARYLHHLGLVYLQRSGEGNGEADAFAAVQLFRRELASLPELGHGYYKGRAQLALAKALAAMKDKKAALDTLAEVIQLARRIQSLGLLAESLQARVQMRLGN